MTTFISYGKVAHFVNNTLMIDGEVVSEFKGLKEAKEYLEALQMSEELQSIMPKQEPKQLTEDVVALHLYENGEQRVTESLVKNYKALVEKKLFYPSDIVLSLREMTDVKDLPNKVEYVMMDGSKVSIDIETNRRLNNIMDLKESADLLKYMTQNTQNFMKCVYELLEDN